MDLRNAACYRLKEDCGLDYEPTQIVVASGAKHSVYIALMTMCNPGDEEMCIRDSRCAVHPR